MAGAPFPTDLTYLGMTEDTAGPVETATGHEHIALRRFHPDIDDPLIGSWETSTMNANKMPVLSFVPKLGGVYKSHAQVYGGAIDSWLNAARDAIGGLAAGKNLIVTYVPEPESADEAQKYGGGVSRYNLGSDYRKAWNYVAKKLKNVVNGVPQNTNVRMAWCLTGYWMDEIAAHDPSADWVAAYYPGDPLVDYISSDPYNWRNCPAHQAPDKTPAQLFGGLLEYAHQHGKEAGIFEYADIVNSRRPRFLLSCIDYFARHNRLKFACYFNKSAAQSGDCNFLLQGDSASVSAYQTLMESDGVKIA